MPYSIHCNNQYQVIQGKVWGIATPVVLRQYTIDMKKSLDKYKKALILSDYREAIFSYSVGDLYNLPRKHDELLSSMGDNIHALKRALLFSKSDDELARFFENVAVNQGQFVKVFQDEDAAIKWLLQ